MNTSKAVTINAIMGKIASITGYAAIVPAPLLLIVGLTDLRSDGAAAAVVILLFILTLCIFLIYKGLQIKKRINRLNQYISLIFTEQTTSLEGIAAGVSQSVDFVRRDLQKMIDKKFIVDAYIDMNRDELVTGGWRPAVSEREQKPLEDYTEPDDSSPGKERRRNPYAMISFVLAAVPFIVLLLICIFFMLLPDDGGSGFIAGAIWPLFLLLGWVFVILMLIDVLAVIFGIIAIIKRKTLFSWMGIIMVALEVLCLFILI